MPLDFRRVYSADAVEGLVSATGPLDHADPRAAVYARRAERAGRACGVERESVLHALRVAVVRMAMRYGSLSDDWHAYHNQGHALDLLENKLPLLLKATSPPKASREALVLFCACHDLRQRENRRHADRSIGANEAASLAETERLLDEVGVDETELRLQLRLAIIGSTFDTDKQDTEHGAFAHRLDAWLDSALIGWRADASAVEAERVARIAADIDTSNVAASYVDFAETAIALAMEIQYRAQRSLESPEAGASCLDFLTEGQERYLFSLQRFASAEGRAAFGAQRYANALRACVTSRALRERFSAVIDAPSGHAVLAAFREIASA